jgi:hypothetical protein
MQGQVHFQHLSFLHPRNLLIITVCYICSLVTYSHLSSGRPNAAPCTPPTLRSATTQQLCVRTPPSQGYVLPLDQNHRCQQPDIMHRSSTPRAHHSNTLQTLDAWHAHFETSIWTAQPATITAEGLCSSAAAAVKWRVLNCCCAAAASGWAHSSAGHTQGS